MYLGGVTALVVGLFVHGRVPVEVTALLCLVLIGVAPMVPGVEPLLPSAQLFAGFSSPAVVAVIAVMVVSRSLDEVGLSARLTDWLDRVAGDSQRRARLASAGTAGLLSAVMQNLAVMATLMPVVHQLSLRQGMAPSRLLMPVGFCVILGGNITLLGSGPLLVLNDLLPEGVARFSLLAPAPVGLLLLLMGLALFWRWGGKLPQANAPTVGTPASRLQGVYGFGADIDCLTLGPDGALSDLRVGEVEERFGVSIVALTGEELLLAPHRDIALAGARELAIIGSPDAVHQLCEHAGVQPTLGSRGLRSALATDRSGIAELMVPPHSALVGKTLREVRMRKTYGFSTLVIYREGQARRSCLRDTPLQAGDVLVCHVGWEELTRLESNPDLVVITRDFPHLRTNTERTAVAGCIALGTLLLLFFSPLPFALSLLVGAVGMLLAGVLPTQSAYAAVSWRTVLLLAGLIPLGQALQHSGMAAWLVNAALPVFGAAPAFWSVAALAAVTASLLALVMSNVGATVLLVPLFCQLALDLGLDPRPVALIVALGASNAFLIPTHQVNALISGPGGYRAADFLRFGTPVSLGYILVVVLVVGGLY